FASTIASSAGRNFRRQITDTMNAPGAEAFALEAAGIGKITLEEGSEVADRIFNFVVNNPELVADYNASQNLTWGSGNIPSGAIYKELVGIAPEVMPAQNLKH